VPGERPTDVMDSHAVRVALGGLSAKTLTRLILSRRFPRPFNVTAQGKVWYRQDVDWYLWGRQIRFRMTPKRSRVVDTGGTTVDNAGTTKAKPRGPVAT
jgi:predicted DNA-binding transcriptional regulator AlpA